MSDKDNLERAIEILKDMAAGCESDARTDRGLFRLFECPDGRFILAPVTVQEPAQAPDAGAPPEDPPKKWFIGAAEGGNQKCHACKQDLHRFATRSNPSPPEIFCSEDCPFDGLGFDDRKADAEAPEARH